MSLALNLPDGGEAELAKIRVEKGITPTPPPSPERSDRSGAKQWRNAAKAFADERDRQEAMGPKSVDQLLSYASKLARGDEIDLDELHAATAWTRPRFLSALAEARRLERWPYRPARPKPLTPTTRVVPEPRKNVDGMTIWPDPPSRPSVMKPPDTEPEPTKTHQTPPTPTRPNQETARMSATVATTTTTRPTTPPPPARPMLYAKGSPPALSPALRETLTAADAIQVDGKVDSLDLADRLGVSVSTISVRICALRKAGSWPYEPARAPGQRKKPQVAKPTPEASEPARPERARARRRVESIRRDALDPPGLDDIRQLLAAQTAFIAELDGLSPAVRAGVVRWIVDNQASLVGGGN